MESMLLYRRGYSHLINFLFTTSFQLPLLENWKAVTQTPGETTADGGDLRLSWSVGTRCVAGLSWATARRRTVRPPIGYVPLPDNQPSGSMDSKRPR